MTTELSQRADLVLGLLAGADNDSLVPFYFDHKRKIRHIPMLLLIDFVSSNKKSQASALRLNFVAL